MQAPAVPANEEQRLHALYELDILDTAAEERFERLTRIARAHTDKASADSPPVEHCQEAGNPGRMRAVFGDGGVTARDA